MKKSRLIRAGLPGISLAQGWSIGQTNRDIAGQVDPSAGESPDDSDTAWRVFGGYEFSRNFALEFG